MNGLFASYFEGWKSDLKLWNCTRHKTHQNAKGFAMPAIQISTDLHRSSQPSPSTQWPNGPMARAAPDCGLFGLSTSGGRGGASYTTPRPSDGTPERPRVSNHGPTLCHDLQTAEWLGFVSMLSSDWWHLVVSNSLCNISRALDFALEDPSWF
jgi:hypothetical protein